MGRSSRQEHFLKLTEKYPFFIFEKQEYVLSDSGLHITFTFNLADQHKFHPTLFIPRKSCFLPDEEISDNLNLFIFNLGMIELISYWKTVCPPKVVIRPFGLTREQVTWWKKLYFHGLGEFFYLNTLDVNIDNFMDIEVASEASFVAGGGHISQQKMNEDAVIIPIGGGKDSAVTLELLGMLPGSIPLIMNPRGASLETIRAMGFSNDRFIEVRRSIDPELLMLNDLGFLNGHTPFSALLAFVTVLAAKLTGHRYIALSNESSANEVTIEGTEINHQYSKSFQFESDFRKYVKSWISEDISYFSFLRPLNELQIACLFSRFTKYHAVFKSCNAGSKTNSWCGKCAKCLFTYIILSPFLDDEKLAGIFGKNLLDDIEMILYLDQLTGIADEKPFDCVGTISEVNIALCETLKQKDEAQLPLLLKHYKDSGQYLAYHTLDFKEAMSQISSMHFIKPEFFRTLEMEMKVALGVPDKLSTEND